ncbi:MAG: molybdate ABC transporter substrate-binding protein [Terrimicrobiaceae bacterium]|nr:molybdate ABC transporter substrate-binding protein [Terrimicrobiaceae bacterium]
MKYLIASIAIVLCSISAGAEEPPGRLVIAAASDLVYCIEQLNKAFAEAHPGIDLKVATGSSGNFSSQIRNGAPFDIFLSADMELPRALARDGFADADSLTLYAIGRIVLWTTRDAVDVSRGLGIVTDAGVHKLAIANPDHAPYGRAAKAALEHEHLWDPVKGKVILGENIAQTAQFVQTGNADAGIVALSLVLSPTLSKVGRYKEIPPEFYPKLEQGAVITSRGMKNPAAKRYIEFLRSEKARRIFDQYGFRLPE